VRAWSQAYRDDGLVVLGVHTPEFSFEHEIDRVRLATQEREIDYPVAFDERRAYSLPERLPANHWALAGEWTIGRERAVLAQAGGSIAYRFHARDAHLVLSTPMQEPIPFRVLLDGEAPGPAHGADVDTDGNGLLEQGRLYQLVREHDTVRERTLQITFSGPGVEAYVFTFG
jgi:hypothetical protein